MNSSTQTRNDAASRPAVSGTPRLLRVVNEHEAELTPVEWFVTQMASDLGLGDRPVDLRRRRILLRIALWASSQGVPLERGLLRVRGDGLTESEETVFVSAPIYAK